MVKLFVGGLPEGVDSIRLRQLFSQFVIVNECDVIKDYAFVHVADEEAVRIAIEKLDGYILENKAINIRRSTSKLRREPGMDKRCYRCGSSEHKTPQCPQEPSMKRTASSNNVTGGAPDQKRLALDPSVAGSSPSYTPTIKIDLTGRNPEVATSVASGGYSYSQSQPAANAQAMAPVVVPVDTDAELPRPLDGDLIPLYEQYLESRTKYFYFRERLMKEVKVRAQLAPYNQPSALQAPYASGMYSAYPPQQQTYSQQATTLAGPYSSNPHYYSTPVGSTTLPPMQTVPGGMPTSISSSLSQPPQTGVSSQPSARLY